MANRNIEITVQVRPCIVHIPEKRKNYQKKGDNLNVYDKVIEPEHEIKALFHCWDHKSELVGESPCYGGHPAGQISQTFGIVEYEDGTVHEVEPENIRFLDNLMSEYAFTEIKKYATPKYKYTDWNCPKCGEGYMKLDEGIVFASNPPMYCYICDKCGHIEFSRSLIDR